MKIIFFGSSDYCIPILEVINNTFHLAAIVTKKGQAVEKFALSHNIKTFIPRDKNELSNIGNDLKLLSPDLAIVADYGLIIPPDIFTIPRHKTLNIHFSKLPALRGPSPVQYTILRGEKSAWITIIIMDAEMDTGDIIWQKPFDYAQGKEETNVTTESLYKKLFDIVSGDLPDVINKFVKNELKPQKQDHSNATYTKHFTRDDGYIPSSVISAAINGKSDLKIKSADFPKNSVIFSSLENCNIGTLSHCIERAYRALTPWPGMWTFVMLPKQPQDTSDGGETTISTPPRWRNQDKKRLKILRVHLEPPTKLVLDLVQLEGKKPVSWKQFLQGYPDNTLITAV